MGDTASGPARAPRALSLVAVAIGVVFAAPLAYLLVRNVADDTDLWATITAPSTLRPLAGTILLTVTVSLSTAVIGTALAWLTVRTDLPGRGAWRVICPLPLVIPSYVGASALLAAVAPGGLVEEVLSPLGVGRLPEVSGFWGAYVVMVLLTYPYVYLVVAARLAGQHPSLEESARLLGRRPGQVFRTVVLPQTAPAIAAGTLLVALYTASDFGAVQLMRYDTLTRRIYETRLIDRPTSLATALLLAVVAVVLVALERRANRQLARTESDRAKRPLVWRLSRWRWPAVAFTALVTGNAILGPIGVLGWWAWRSMRNDTGVGSLGAAPSSVVGPLVTTVGLGLAAAALTVAVVLPIAYATSRYRDRAASVSSALVVSGFALPGLVLALALITWTLQAPWLRPLYQTIPLLLLAYAMHFGGPALRASTVAVSGVPRRLLDAAKLLGAGRIRRFVSVDIPLMLPGLLAAAGLVLLSTMKELPATLLLAPTGTETLATRIWHASEALFLGQLGTTSLVLIAVSALLTWLLVVRQQRHLVDGPS